MKKKLIIFPFNGNGLEAFDCLTDEFDFIGYADDTPEKQKKYEHFEVFSREIITQYPEAKILAVLGSPANHRYRHEIIGSLQIPESRFATIVHPKASVAKLAKIGYNTLVMAGVVITSNATIGNHICILPNTVIHHDVTIGDYSLLGSNITLAGSVQIGENCYVGSGTSIIQNTTIGKFSLIGMGSNVLKNVPENSKVVGNPARLI
ncbi:MAG: acetyltransferase [Bacteroidetes bacterium]|nr:MAG: acetyltransferase [Bacteroidota bacterium]